jgi:hypothetical protein
MIDKPLSDREKALYVNSLQQVRRQLRIAMDIARNNPNDMARIIPIGAIQNQIEKILRNEGLTIDPLPVNL